MNLLNKTNRYYITFSIIAYLLIAGVFYIVTEFVIYQEVESRLKVERQDFEHYVQEHGVWESSCYFVEDKIDLKRVTDTLRPLTVFKDTIYANRYSEEIDPFRQHTFYATIGNENFKVRIRKSLIEWNKLLSFITGTMLVLLSAGLTVLFFLQRRVSKNIWKPFYSTLSRAKSFDISHGSGLVIPTADIYEFQELNKVLEKMTRKIASDYQNLKEFTENAAHEIQTPLALINTRIEELVQGTNFTEQQMYWIQQIHTSTMRLSKLHQGLLLLSKIDNGQFMEKKDLTFNDLVRRKLDEYEEVFAHKQLTVNCINRAPFVMAMNPALADILITNLLTNAIKHNIQNGRIQVEITADHLKVMNTGLEIHFNPVKLFERFKKNNQASPSLGLGLAIVKKICDSFDLAIDYTNKGSFHEITCSRKADGIHTD